jgi:hypothetical protein
LQQNLWTFQGNDFGHGVKIPVAVKEKQMVFDGNLSNPAIYRAAHGHSIFSAEKIDSRSGFKGV